MILPTSLGSIHKTTFTQISSPIDIRLNRIYYGCSFFNIRYLSNNKVVMVDMANPYYLNIDLNSDVLLRLPVPRADNAWIYVTNSSWFDQVESSNFKFQLDCFKDGIVVTFDCKDNTDYSLIVSSPRPIYSIYNVSASFEWLDLYYSSGASARG